MLMDLRGFWPVRRLGLLRGGGPSRITIAPSERVGFSAHSFLAQAVDNIADEGDPFFMGAWQGGYDLHMMPYSSLAARWDANGMDRTGSYSGALWLTEFTNPYAGWPAPDSAESLETLQHLYWYALTAQAKGCRVLFIYPPWSPQSVDAALDGQTMAQAVFWRDWLTARPDVTLAVYVMPVPVIVRQIRDYFAAPPIGPAFNDQAATVRGIVASGVTATGATLVTNGSDARRTYCMPAPPSGAVVEFDITTNTAVYLRLDNESGLEAPFTNVWQTTEAGTFHVTVTLPNHSSPILGFLIPTSGRQTTISNWTVTGPASSPFKAGDDLHLSNSTSGSPLTATMAALGAGLIMMMRGARLTDDPGWSAQMRDLVGIVWRAIAEFECTGLGGGTVVVPVTSSNPLSAPQGLPA